jgi:hypothetical protein
LPLKPLETLGFGSFRPLFGGTAKQALAAINCPKDSQSTPYSTDPHAEMRDIASAYAFEEYSERLNFFWICYRICDS